MTIKNESFDLIREKQDLDIVLSSVTGIVLSDDVVREYLSKCQALIFPGEEDFGITPVEAQASGRPVIAYRGGGAVETVAKHTGQFFYPKTAEALVQTVKKFEPGQFDSQLIRQHTQQFDIAVFRQKMTEFLEKMVFTTKTQRIQSF